MAKINSGLPREGQGTDKKWFWGKSIRVTFLNKQQLLQESSLLGRDSFVPFI
jgi:hypothetical protein